ncbi:hypothetical protein TSOC_000182 [Tetrabaena socialis]|uniref:mTERF domain-containing protein 1, mitochondrial n=1 Tax=Tetrabaena socialis TaxID=47790 RepID=A0A2J8AJW4_9CHLO|nr:hypothetical protein TSOC_000182 [Tetrabaena socialis]|eukprot:PNH12815.1 hypothetical protein TSOC_000182 [Tetrabaena socialis]
MQQSCRAGSFRRCRTSNRPQRPTRPTSAAALRPDDLARLSGISPDEAARAWNACPALADEESEAGVVGNLAYLRATFSPRASAGLVRRRPELLTVRLEEWVQFLTGYGLREEAVLKVLRYSPALLLPGGAGAPPNTPYNAGLAVVFLKSYGWTDEAVMERVLPCYPRAAVDFLSSRGFDEEAVRRVVQNFPQLLVGSFSEAMFPLIDRIRASAHNKYVVSGSYHV